MKQKNKQATGGIFIQKERVVVGASGCTCYMVVPKIRQEILDAECVREIARLTRQMGTETSRRTIEVSKALAGVGTNAND